MKSSRELMQTATGAAFETAAVFVLNALLLFLLFPITPRATIPLLLISGAAVVALRRYRRDRRRRQIVTSLALTSAAIVWAVLAPFFAAGPLYVYGTGRWNPLATKLVPMKDDRRQYGTLLIISDPIRDRLATWLDRKFPLRYRRLAADDLGRSVFLRIPIKTAFRHVLNGPTYAEGIRTLRVPFFGVGFGIRAHNATIMISAAPTSSTPVNTEYYAAADREHWEHIAVGREPSDAALTYAALLDFALTSASRGRIDRTIGALEAALPHAPSDLETARTLCLLSEAAHIRLTGDLGELQYIAYFTTAARVYLRHVERERLQRQQGIGPVERWVYATLLGTAISRPYLEYQRAMLEQVDVKAFQTDSTKPDFEERWAELRSMWKQQYADGNPFDLEEQRVSKMTPAEYERAVRQAARDPERARRLFHFSRMRFVMPALLERDLTRAGDGAHAAAALTRTFDRELRTAANEWLATHQRLRDMTRALADAKDDEEMPPAALNSVIESYRASGLGRLAELAGRTVAAEKNGTSTEYRLIPAPNRDWWETEYLEWFFLNTWAIAGAAEDNVAPQIDPKYAVEHWQRDRAGTGHSFLPGIAYLLQLNTDRPPALTQKLRDELGRSVGRPELVFAYQRRD